MNPPLTLKEKNELKLISYNTEIVNGETNVRYTFVKDLSCLPNNTHQVVKVAEKLRSSPVSQLPSELKPTLVSITMATH